ncbi:MAG: tripartite tricarboxylate transporter substrate binding protein [Pseudomonadota bacterium]
MKRREILLASAAAIGLISMRHTVAQDDKFPVKPLKWIVSWPPGGGADFVARVIANQMSIGLGQPIVIENRPGGAGIIGAEYAARSAPDGYTLYSGDNGPLVFNTALFRTLPYDPVRDFASVSMIGRYPLVLVANSNVKAGNAKEWFDEARRQPGKMSYASIGAGSAFHLAMELLKKRTGTDVVHVAYRGAGPAMQDVIGGQVPVTVISCAAAIPLIKAGKLKALAVLTAERQAQLPDVPTMAELGIKGAEVYAWQGLVVPAKTPASRINRLHDELLRALASSEVQQKFLTHGVEAKGSTPQELTDYVRSESALWQPLIKEWGITLE